MIVSRRLSLKALLASFGVALPLTGVNGVTAIRAISQKVTRSAPTSAALPAGLEAWLRLPQRPLISRNDLADCQDPRIHALATIILARLNSGEELVFRYYGGSDASAIRTVHPVLLFRKCRPDAADARIEPSPQSPLYLLAHCQTRNAPRTFRLDRMTMATG